MLGKKVPLRMCIACKESKPKKELLRVVKTPGGDFELDYTGKLNGRGAYICNNDACVNELLKRKLLNKSFKENISNSVYDKIKESYFGNKQN